MASQLLDRLKRSLFKDGQGARPKRLGQKEDGCEAELEEEDECVAERVGGTLSFDGSTAAQDRVEGEGSGLDSDSDFLGESLEDVLSSTDASPVSPASFDLGGTGARIGHTSTLSFEVTDASVVQNASSKYVLYTIDVIQAGGSDKTPAVITRRYSDFQRLHATLRHHHRDQMEPVCFPRKKLRRNFTAETIAKRSRAFEQYLTHLCSLPGLWGTSFVRHFFYLPDLQTGQLLLSVDRYQDALGPLLNAKRLQDKLGGPPDSLHWLFTLVGLCCCFQEVEQLEEARDQCDHALRVLIERMHVDGPHPLLPPLLRAVVRLSWQTGQDKRQWEELLHTLEEQGAGLEDHLEKSLHVSGKAKTNLECCDLRSTVAKTGHNKCKHHNTSHTRGRVMDAAGLGGAALFVGGCPA
ncbi:sorting nexin-21 isoform X1 [Phyllopteryx taeniolatus]|uniref:sorting nexin-21 isoform X1 n=1 Tax=Phyllopteryx taeniolatus TaxID=161469 RepID=UPI002AD3EB34|nr:sorting nexin-21 isoform X1 [Phyllopteryx taeniolatus]XP_061621152.1 sorting nexin-21 isoform X1 [Phyllopteryx taeniolatus]XP_061621153.1 sorting nexin-21 isoform X1 [Phyllopteryx taeniolatus]XP_061621154.1 sorting nexin-21 isoform X1 [Phyllopteryx taeniolatus]